jgi:hypothetical protein
MQRRAFPGLAGAARLGRAAGAGLLALVLALALAGGGAAAGAARGPAAAPPAAGGPAVSAWHAASKADKKGGKAAKAGSDPFLLPANYRNADGSFNQEAILARQKTRLDAINAKLGTKLRMSETPHYLLFSDADAPVTAQFTQWSEALYASLCGQFGIGDKERIWDGKCILLIFRSRPKFVEFARVFDENNAADAGAFFAWEHYAAGMPECVHISIPLDERDPRASTPARTGRRLQELFAHEGTHAFIQLFHKPVELPLWLHEGLAEYMTVVNDPALRPLKTAPAVAAARAGASLDRLLAAVTGDDLKIQEYSVAFTLVDYLQQAGKPKFKQFVLLLKEGKDQPTALKTAYGFDADGLSKRWRAFLLAESGPKRR